MNNNLFARMPLPRNLLNIDSTYNRNYFNSEPPPEDAHDIAMRLLGREPTPDEVGARMMEALRTRAVPDASGDNFPDRGPFGFVHDALADVRDRYEAANRQYQGEGRREENVPELPLNIRIDGNDTWAAAKMALGRSNDRAVDDIALAQLPGAGFRRDQWGNLIVRLPNGATVPETYASGIADRAPTYEERERTVGDQEFYVNRPGFSSQDARNELVDQVPGAAGGLVGAGVSAASKNPGRGIAASAATTAGANILLDRLARSVGSRQPVDWRGAAEEGSGEFWPSPWDAPEIWKYWFGKK